MFVWDVDPVLLKLGPLQIRYYGVCFLIALMGGFYWIRWQLKRGGHGEEAADRFVLPAVIAVIAGARLGHVFFYEAHYYLAHPEQILYFWRGGLASHGATIGLIVMCAWYARREKMPVAEVYDRFTFSVAWAAAWVRVGNFMNSEIVGRVTDVPWAVKFPRHDVGLPPSAVPWRHPSQLYEVVLGFTVLGLLLLADRKWGENRPRGALAFLFLASYFTGRFLVEFFKAYQTLSPGDWPLTMGQWLSIPFALIGWVGFVWAATRQKRA